MGMFIFLIPWRASIRMRRVSGAGSMFFLQQNGHKIPSLMQYAATIFMRKICNELSSWR